MNILPDGQQQNARRIIKKEHLFPLDFVRAIGTLMIVIFHYNMSPIEFPEVVKPNVLFLKYANGSMGHIGVSVFFILTGASLMYVYSDRLELKDYFKKRFFAIFPLYWTVFGAFFFYFYILKQSIPLTLPLSRLLLTAIGMDGYLKYLIPNYYLVGEWFVGCILLIYLCFPLVRRAMITWPVPTAAAAMAGYLFLNLCYPFTMDIQYFFLIRLPEVMFGMYFMKYYYEKKVNRESFDWKWALPAAIVFGVVFTVPLPLPVPFLILLTGIPCFLLLIWAGGWIRGRRLKAVFSSCSKYSFSVFLTHHILVGKFVHPFSGTALGTGQNLLLFCAYFLTVCAVSWVFYHLSRLIFRPLQDLLDRPI